MEIIFFQNFYMFQGTFYQALRGDAAIFFYQLFFQRTTVYANTDGDMFFFRHLHHLTDTVFIADIAGVDTNFINAQFHHTQCQTIIKVDICYQRNMNLFFDFTNGICRFHIRHCYTHQFTACCFQGMNLRHSSCHISGICITHGLDDNRIAAAQFQIANLYGSCFRSLHICTPFYVFKSIFRYDIV